MADPFTSGALISAGGNLIGDFLGGIFGGGSARRAHRYNVRMWNLQNEYNHPSAQMARLREAGLNPNLIYGTSPTSAVGQAGPAPQFKQEEWRFQNPLKDIMVYQDLKMRQAQTDNFRAQNDVIHQDASLKAAQTANTMADTINKSQQKLNLQAQHAQTAAQTRNIMTQQKQNALNLRRATELYDDSIEAYREDVRQKQLRNAFQRLQNSGISLDNSFKDATLLIRINKWQADLMNAYEELEGKQLENRIKEIHADMWDWGVDPKGTFNALPFMAESIRDLGQTITEGFESWKQKRRNKK